MTQYPSKTRSEQYLDARDRMQDALSNNDLENALQCINAALWVEYDLNRQAMELTTRDATDINFADAIGYPCTAEGAVDLLIDLDEIGYNVDVHQFGYIGREEAV